MQIMLLFGNFYEQFLSFASCDLTGHFPKPTKRFLLISEKNIGLLLNSCLVTWVFMLFLVIISLLDTWVFIVA